MITLSPRTLPAAWVGKYTTASLPYFYGRTSENPLLLGTWVNKIKKRGRPPPRYAARPAVKIPPGRGAGAAGSRSVASGAVL
jgi:hypothetical protein